MTKAMTRIEMMNKTYANLREIFPRWIAFKLTIMFCK